MKKVLAVTLAAAMVASMAACGESKPAETKAPETKAEETKGEETKAEETKAEEPSGDPIYFAYSGPLTGDNKEYGELFRNAFELAINEQNEAGGVLGRKIEWVEFDDKNAAEEAGSIAEKIVDDDKIVAVFGHFSSSVAMTAAQTYQEEGIVLLSASASHVDYSGIGDYIFRNNVTQKVEAKNCLEIAQKMGVKKVGILKLKTDWGESCYANFMAGIEELGDKCGFEIVAQEEFVDGTTDYASNITKFEEAGVDCIVDFAQYAALGAFAKQYRMQNTETLLISVGSSYTPELINLAGEYAEGIMFPGGMNADSTDPVVKTFVDNYKAYAGGKVPENMASQTYDNVRIAIKAIEEAGSVDREAIKDALYKVTLDSVTGPLAFDEIGDAKKVQTWYVVEGGKFVESDKGTLQAWDDFVAAQ